MRRQHFTAGDNAQIRAAGRRARAALQFGGVIIMGNLMCATCKRPMALRTRNRDGKFFFGCSGYPHCKSTHPSDPHGQPLTKPEDPSYPSDPSEVSHDNA